jgi:tellurite resistance protein
MAKKNAGSSMVLVGAMVVVGIVASVPKEVWGTLFVAGAVAFVIRVVVKMMGSGSRAKPVQRVVSTPRSAGAPAPQDGGSAAPAFKVERAAVPKDEFASFVLSVEPQTAEHRIPIPEGPVGSQWKWVPVGETVSVAGFEISGGLLYVGSGLRARYGEVDPALIDPKLSVASAPVVTSLRLMDYWSSYSNITPDARRVYLQWLAGGRRDPSADIGYVFLFFYGLERRALVDVNTDHAANVDIPAIKVEVQRLLGIYGGSNSFRQYATHFLAYLDAEQVAEKVYLDAPPAIPDRCYELPLGLKIGLGQLAADQQPVPANWALAWALADPNISRRTAVTRCGAEFARMFQQKYAAEYGEGLRLRNNKTKLQCSYQPASAGLCGQSFQQSLGGLPDVSAVKVPVQKLQALVDTCTSALEPYSRFVGRNPDKAHALEALLQLPVDLWPAAVKAELNDLKSRVGDGMVVMLFGELSGRLKSAGPLSRDKVVGLARALQDLQLGMEPDVLAGVRPPKAEDKIALFAASPDEGSQREGAVYQAAAVTLDLACMVALADGDASAQELLTLTRYIDSWSHLSVVHRKRLKAHLRLGIEQPATLAGVKKKFEHLADDARRSIARFLAHLTQADGVVSPSEVKFLERTYRALGLDIKLVYADLHANDAPAPATAEVGSANSKPQGFSLDPARIAQLQKETAEVAALLANVFVEEGEQESAEVVTALPEEEAEQMQTGLLGLDASHSAFVRLLVTRSSWLRDELADAASDMELMLDGALEHINEAALDACDAPLTEGDDPIDINQEVLEALPV